VAPTRSPGDAPDDDVLGLIRELERKLEAERQRRRTAESRLYVELAAYEALLAGAFPRVPRIPNPDE
jgi:hypothetical protein